MSNSMGGGSSSSGRARSPLGDLNTAGSNASRGRSSQRYTEDTSSRSKRSARSASTGRRQRLRSTAAGAENADPVRSALALAMSTKTRSLSANIPTAAKGFLKKSKDWPEALKLQVGCGLLKSQNLRFHAGPATTTKAVKGEGTAISAILHLVFFYSPVFTAKPSWRTSASLEEYPILKMAYRVYRARGGVSSASTFVGKLVRNLSAAWSECHKHVRVTVCRLSLQAVKCVESDVKAGHAPSKLTARKLAKEARKSLRKLPDDMKTALGNLALAPILSPAKHCATASGGSGILSVGTSVPWHDVFGCSEHLFYDMVILPLAKEFLGDIGAQHAAAVSVYRQSHGGDDSESDDDDSTEDPSGFDTHRTIRELINTKQKLPPGGGGKKHKTFLARFKNIMLGFVQEVRGELPAANECSLEVAEEFSFPCNYTNGVLGGDDAETAATHDNLADGVGDMSDAGGEDEEGSGGEEGRGGEEGSSEQENADTEPEYVLGSSNESDSSESDSSESDSSESDSSESDSSESDSSESDEERMDAGDTDLDN